MTSAVRAGLRRQAGAGAAAVDHRDEQDRLRTALTDHLGGLQHRHAPGGGVLGEGDPVARLQGSGDSAAAAVVLRLLRTLKLRKGRPRMAATAAVPKATASAPMVRPPMAVMSRGRTPGGRRPRAACRRDGTWSAWRR